MMSKKSAILVGISMVIGFQISKIYVPHDFERPFFYKFKFVSMHLMGFMAKFAEKLNYGIEPSNFRYLLRAATKILKKESDESVIVTDTKINKVNVRIYTPQLKEEKLIPILIWIHGGAYSIGDLNTYDHFLFELTKRLKLKVISIDYKLAPEYAFPVPVNDCYSVAVYILENASEFNGDESRIIIAGDSAGGNAVAVITQRLAKEKKNLPKLQILVYPWLQMFNFRLPSSIAYSETGLMSKFSLPLCAAWYLGLNKVSEEIETFLKSNNHTILIKDEELRNKFISYLDVDVFVPEKYKIGKKYYTDFNIKKQYIYPNKFEIDDDFFILKDKKLTDLLNKMFSSDFSPALADLDKLKDLSKAYFIIAEWDTLKDEGIIYAERLKKAGNDVTIDFYEKAFHGQLTFINHLAGYSVSFEMLDNMTKFIKENI